MRTLLLLLLIQLSMSVSFAQDNTSIEPFIRLRTGEVLYFDEVSLSKKQVTGTKDGVSQTFDAKECETALLAEKKKDKLVIKRHVLFADRGTSNNLGGEAVLEPGNSAFSIVVRNGNTMIIYKPSYLAGTGGGVTGNQTVFYHIKNGVVSKIELQEWRDDALIQSFVKDFGLCPELKKALQDFNSSGKGARQVKYEWAMDKIEKTYLLNCPATN